MSWYPLWVALGIAAAVIAAARQPAVPGIDPDARARLALAATIGAVLGAYLMQLPADFLGWTAPPPAGAASDVLPLGGRTVLGGLLGGWLAVEAAKRARGIRAASGDGFAVPLALALAFGRLGCASAGCCAGRACAARWWAWPDAAGVPRLPVQLVEAGFHAIAALILAWAARRGAWPGRRLAAYLTVYAALRFALEGVREHPPVALGLSWYRWLALALFALAGATWWRRARRAGLPAAASPA